MIGVMKWAEAVQITSSRVTRGLRLYIVNTKRTTVFDADDVKGKSIQCYNSSYTYISHSCRDCLALVVK